MRPLKHNSARHKDQRGFSLIEIVVAIVIMGVMAIGLTQFIVDSASGYSISASRNQVSSAGRIVIDRIAMELHNALPESVRISDVLTAADETAGLGYAGDQCIEFIPVRAASTYIDPAFRPAAFKAAFTTVDFVPTQEGENGVYAAIYPTSDTQLYSDTFGPANTTSAIARVNVTAGAGSTDTLTYSRLSDDMPYNHRFLRSSSVERIFLTDQPVSFCVSGNKLYRYSDYGFKTVAMEQMVPLEPDGDCTAGAATDCLPAATPERVLVTDMLDNSTLTGGAGQAFNLEPVSRRRNAVIQLEFIFSQDGQEMRLNHEVLQQATP